MDSKKTKSLLLSLAIASVTLTPGLAWAHDGHDHSEAQSIADSSSSQVVMRDIDRHSIQELRDSARIRQEELKDSAKAKRAEVKDQARIARCEKKQAKLKEKYATLQDRSQSVANQIQARLDRAQAFVVKKNLQVPNNISLLADIEAKRQVVLVAIENIRGASAGFDCADDNAKEQAMLIRTEVQSFKSAVKDYRGAIKAYFSAVIQAYTATLSKETISPSPASVNEGGSQ